MKTKKINFHEATTFRNQKKLSSKINFNYKKEKSIMIEEQQRKNFRKADTVFTFDPRVHMNLSKADLNNLNTYEKYDKMKWMVDVAVLHTGHSFGELALVNNEPRQASI
tara:strand:- start:24 stop:350 length:327 start_codon:yes stop_codon:yes gene_type:complete